MDMVNHGKEKMSKMWLFNAIYGRKRIYMFKLWVYTGEFCS